MSGSSPSGAGTRQRRGAENAAAQAMPPSVAETGTEPNAVTTAAEEAETVAVAAGPAATAGTQVDETGAGVVRDGFVLDFISGTKTRKETPREQVRQRTARALHHEYGISVDDMEADFPVAAGGGGSTWRSSPPGSRTSPGTSSGWWSAAPSRSRTSAAP